MKIAINGFVAGRTLVRKGDVVADDDPKVELSPGSFVDAEQHLAARSGIETATARPGEARTTRPPKSAAKKG